MNPIERALAALRACDAQLELAKTNSLSSAERVNIGAARMMAKASITELERMNTPPLTEAHEPVTDLHKLFEESWTCQCDKCGIKSYHDSDVAAPCIKGAVCGGTMESRAIVQARIDMDIRR